MLTVVLLGDLSVRRQSKSSSKISHRDRILAPRKRPRYPPASAAKQKLYYLAKLLFDRIQVVHDVVLLWLDLKPRSLG